MKREPGGSSNRRSRAGHRSSACDTCHGKKKSGSSRSSPVHRYQPVVSDSGSCRSPCNGHSHGSPSITDLEAPSLSLVLGSTPALCSTNVRTCPGRCTVSRLAILPMSGPTRRDGPGCRCPGRSVDCGELTRSGTRIGLRPTPDPRVSAHPPVQVDAQTRVVRLRSWVSRPAAYGCARR
jgi:hypothetical protein